MDNKSLDNFRQMMYHKFYGDCRQSDPTLICQESLNAIVVLHKTSNICEYFWII